MLFERQSFLVAGLSRSGISAAEYLLSKGAKTYLYDDVGEGAVLAAAQELGRKGAVLLAGEEAFSHVGEIDVLVLSPGIPIDHPLPVAFRKAGKRVTGEAELGAMALRCPVVAVTGTNGKTTTVSLIDAMFRAAGKKSVLCGNIGTPVTACLKELGEDAVAVAEISSFQLETLRSLCPHVAVVLNVTEDHLNRHYNMENYVYLKSRLLRNCTESEYAVLNFDDPVVRAFSERTKAKCVGFSLREKTNGAYIEDGALCYAGERILPESTFPLEGDHNKQDALAAVCAAKLMGLPTEAIAKALAEFRGVKHRIEKIGRAGGVTFIDDSKATNVDAAVHALASITEETVLLVGGKDKGYSYEPLFDAVIRSSVVHTVIYGENAFRVLKAALSRNVQNVTLCRSFDMAVRIAYLTAKPGQTVLLSPASASFDEFTGYEARGERFREIVQSLAEEPPRRERGDAEAEE